MPILKKYRYYHLKKKYEKGKTDMVHVFPDKTSMKDQFFSIKTIRGCKAKEIQATGKFRNLDFVGH